MEGLLTMPEIAQRLNIRQSTLRAYKARKQMPEPSLVIGNKPLWTEETIQEWVQKRSN